jgi:hypothetical protein
MPEEPRRLKEDLAAAGRFSGVGMLRTLRAENTEAVRNSTSVSEAERLTLVLGGEYSKG